MFYKIDDQRGPRFINLNNIDEFGYIPRSGRGYIKTGRELIQLNKSQSIEVSSLLKINLGPYLNSVGKDVKSYLKNSINHESSKL